MDVDLAAAVRSRARDVCEYCRLPQPARRLRFQIEHIISRQHGGVDVLENLALACGRCNRHKGPNIAGIDPATGQLIRLFNPRSDRWAEHFHWDEVLLSGRTAIGRATVEVLSMNHPEDIAIRLELMASGRWPPYEQEA